MANLIKMDLRRMFRSPMFFISVGVVAVFNILLNIGIAFISRMFAPGAAIQTTVIGSVVSSPFVLSLFIILMFASLVSFSYADIAGGYIKNIAGQLPRKSDLIISKFIVCGVHNLIFFAAGSLTNTLSILALSNMGMAKLTDDGMVLAAIATLLLKWLLSMAITAILLFVTNGIKNKVLASVIGVILGTGSLGFAYLGLNAALSNIFGIKDFNVSDIMPDSLMNSVSVSANTAVVNAIIVSVVCIAVFLTLTVKVFNSRDVK